MRVRQLIWTPRDGWDRSWPSFSFEVQLGLVFWSVENDLAARAVDELRAACPNACLAGCSTAGEIAGNRVLDGTVCVTLLEFEHAVVRGAKALLSDAPDSHSLGVRLANALPNRNLRHVLVFSDGMNVNGSEFTRGLTSALPSVVSITGGMAGDAERFQKTFVLSGGELESGVVTAIGLYGESLVIGFGTRGGWDAFGPDRMITRSEGNVLYEMDGESALGIYEKYLGKHAAGLPATGLLFPLSLRREGAERSLVRTVRAVDRETQSMTFGGDVPQGMYARFMMANFERIVDGAVAAAHAAVAGTEEISLALLISCVGRKLMLKQMIEEEVEGVADVLGPNVIQVGFYSYGELAPYAKGGLCELHNQTMTITTIGERCP